MLFPRRRQPIFARYAYSRLSFLSIGHNFSQNKHIKTLTPCASNAKISTNCLCRKALPSSRCVVARNKNPFQFEAFSHHATEHPTGRSTHFKNRNSYIANRTSTQSAERGSAVQPTLRNTLRDALHTSKIVNRTS